MRELKFRLIRKTKYKEKPTGATESLHSLGPRIISDEKDLKSIKPYLDLLSDCIEDNRITNIAITGTYGSGKSTILKTFQNWYKPFKEKEEDKYLNISLASFDLEESNNKKASTDDNGNSKDFERRVELSILQQMFYQVEPNLLPASRFKRIKNINSNQLFGYITFIILWLASLSTLFNFEFVERTPLRYLVDNPSNWWNLIPWIISLFGISIIIWKLIYLFNNSRIHKVSIKGEMVLGDMGESIFNQYLEEILYFFERTEYEVVIIEDLDRFGDTQLFTKLREVNILLNTSKPINRRIKFIYAIKDDIFKDRTERTKFFDFIVPIIPFVNPHNASEQLIRLLKDKSIQLSDDFIEDITGFIGDIDMRLIINIFNEFNLYRKKISVRQLDKLIAIIFYKNLYPDDFAALHQDKGKLFDLLSKKKDYQSILKEKYEEQIVGIDKRLKRINDENIESIQELRSVYLFNLIAKLPEFYQFDMGFKNIKDAVLDENFKKISSSKTIKYKKIVYDIYQRRNVTKPVESAPGLFSEIETKISEAPYSLRENSIRNKINGKLERLRKKKLSISNELSKVDLLRFAVLYEKVGKDEDFGNFNDDGSLIRYLVLRGYIDDDYRDYLSLFFDVSITREDYEFIQNVKLAKSASFDFKPSNSQKVLAKINKSHLAQSSSLNYELVSYCLRNKSTESEKLKLYRDLLSTNDDVNLKFILGFAKNKSEDIQLLISEFSESKTNLWDQLLKVNLPKKELQKWVVLIFDCFNNIENILNLENIESLEEYITQENIFEFAGLLESDKNLKGFLRSKNIKITSLDIPQETQTELFQFIYEDYHFKLNIDNIIQIVSVLKPEVNTSLLMNSNYSTLKSLNLDLLLKIIDGDFANYTNRILLSENNNMEFEDTIIEVLNRRGLDIEIKERFLLHQGSNIQSLYNVEDLEVKKIILNSDRLIPNWINVFNYLDSLEGNKLDITLINFLNKQINYVRLSKYKTKEAEKEDEYLKAFDSKLIRANKLNNEAYSHLLNSLRYSYKTFSLDNIDQEKVKILIKQKVLSFTKSNYNEIIDTQPRLALYFLKKNQVDKDFVSKIDEFVLEDDALIELISSSEFNESHKVKIVENIEEDRITSNAKLANCIFKWWSESINISFSFRVLEMIFKNSLNIDKKVEMLLHFINELNNDELKALTTLIGEEFEKLFIPFQQPKFDNYKNTLTLIEALDEKQLISSFKKENNSIKAFPYNK